MLRRKPPPERQPRDRADEFASFVVERPAARMVTPALLSAHRPAPRDEPHYSEAWRRAVASLPNCVRCNSPIGNQAAHRNQGKGMGMKTDDCLTAALCPPCHSELDQGKTLTREERRQEIDTAILKTLVLLFRAGKVRAFGA